MTSETLLGGTVIGKVPVETIQVNPATTLHNKRIVLLTCER